ncbi:MAG: A24 family peptidase [Anaerolineales bacterium]
MRLVYALIALLGLALGGAINALADSLPYLRKPNLPRCVACGATRPPHAWLGLAALVTGSLRCRSCNDPLSWRNPMVELVSMGGAIYLYASTSSAAEFWPALAVGFVFLLIAVIDIEHRLILFAVTIPSALVFVLIGWIDPDLGPVKTLVGGAAGFAIVYVLFLLGGVFGKLISRLRGRRLDDVAFGFGDVMLAGLIGLAVGWPGVIMAIFLGIFSAGVFALGFIAVMLLRRRYRPLQAFPYGPFLIFGAMLLYYAPDLLRRVFAG